MKNKTLKEEIRFIAVGAAGANVTMTEADVDRFIHE